MPRRLALLVATYRYQDAGLRQLTAPGHDAEALAEVLRDPEIANFDVTILINEPHYVAGDAIGKFYHNRRRDDLTLLYFTRAWLERRRRPLVFRYTLLRNSGERGGSCLPRPTRPSILSKETTSSAKERGRCSPVPLLKG